MATHRVPPNTMTNREPVARGTYHFVAPHCPVIDADRGPRRTNRVIFSRPPCHLGYGRPAQSAAGQP